MSDIKQVYKSRAEAYSLFIQPGRYPVSRSKFYEDCARLKIIQSDKTLLLADLLAYAKSELEIALPESGRSLADEEHARTMRDLERRKLIADVEAKEKANRKDDARWMEVVEHEMQMAAFAGQIEESLQQLTVIKLSELIYLCGGDIRKAAEFDHGLSALYTSALTEAVKQQTKPIHFADEDPDVEHGD